MQDRINEYLDSKGLVMLCDLEYEELVCHVRNRNKVDAIKALRTFSKCIDERYIQDPTEYEGYTNDFYAFLVDNGRTCYEGPDSRCLGLKEAKCVVDVMFANLDAL